MTPIIVAFQQAWDTAYTQDPFSVNRLPIQFSFSTAVVWIIDWMKRSNWFPWITTETASLNRIVALIGAALTTAGIHFVFEKAAAAEGVYTMTVTGLTLLGIFHFARGFVLAVATQQTILKVYQITNLLRNIADRFPATIDKKE